MAFFNPMLAHEYGKHAHKVKFPALVQPKLDGVRAVWDGATLWTRNGREIEGVPHILDALLSGYSGVRLDGEIFTRSMRFDEINGLVRRTMDPRESALQYWAFDCLSSPESPYAYRLRELESICHHDGEIVRCVGSIMVGSSDAVDEALSRTVAEGFEGVMVKDPEAAYQFKRTSALLKLKPWRFTVGRLSRVEAGAGKHAGRLGALVVEGDGWQCSVGTGFSDGQRGEIWSNPDGYIGKLLRVKYQELTGNGIPRFPVFAGFA